MIVELHQQALKDLKDHGVKVFGSLDKFSDWLDEGNLFLSGKKPLEFLGTLDGIKLIDDRLTGIEYGDNA